MKNYQVFRKYIRRICTSVPSSMKISVQFLKATENIATGSKSAVDANAPLKSLPKSFRAQKKLEPKQAEFLRKQQPLSIGAYALLAIPVTTFGLGVWQVDRRRQKLQKIQSLEENTKRDPAPLPQDLRDLAQMEYQPVRVIGEFCHDEEIIVKPRHRHDSYKLGGVQTDAFSRMNEVGAQIITPFKVADRPYKILIQRGWVPLSHVEAEKREAGQIKGQVEVVGLVRGNEKRPKFVPENEPLEGEWHYRDVEMMARIRNAAPAYLEAVASTTIEGGPIGGQTILRLRNEHISYIVTWFTLSAFTSWLWFRRYVRPLAKV